MSNQPSNTHWTTSIAEDDLHVRLSPVEVSRTLCWVQFIMLDTVYYVGYSTLLPAHRQLTNCKKHMDSILLYPWPTRYGTSFLVVVRSYVISLLVGAARTWWC
jgi:hypothetical protein